VMTGGTSYVVYLAAWVLLHFAWQGLLLMLSWQLCDWILHSAPPTLRYRVGACT
jgi:hypothetical protein